LAKEIDVAAQWISEIVAGKRAITAYTDLRLCRYSGLSSGYRLRAQAAHDTEVAERNMAHALIGSFPGRLNLPKNARQRIPVQFVADTAAKRLHFAAQGPSHVSHSCVPTPRWRAAQHLSRQRCVHQLSCRRCCRHDLARTICVRFLHHFCIQAGKGNPEMGNVEAIQRRPGSTIGCGIDR
jgi:hypothetical protein